MKMYCLGSSLKRIFIICFSVFLVLCLVLQVSAQQLYSPPDQANYKEYLIEAEAFTDPGWSRYPKGFLSMEISGDYVVDVGSATGYYDLNVASEGDYYLWVRSHGVSSMQFKVKIDGAYSSEVFGTANMNWKAGGTFHLTTGVKRIEIVDAANNPYADAIILSNNPSFKPNSYFQEYLIEAESFTDPGSWSRYSDGYLPEDISGDYVLKVGGGTGYYDLDVVREGDYYLWVRSHGTSTRQFNVKVDGVYSSEVFGTDNMDWKEGGVFHLTTGLKRIEIVDATGYPYADAFFVTNHPNFNPENIEVLPDLYTPFQASDRLVEGEDFTHTSGCYITMISGYENSNDQVLGISAGATATYTVNLSTSGNYNIWVKSHGTTGRSFLVKIDNTYLSGSFGTAAMRWDNGGTFNLASGNHTIIIEGVSSTTYCDCISLTTESSYGFTPEDWHYLKAMLPGDIYTFPGISFSVDNMLTAGKVISSDLTVTPTSNQDEYDVTLDVQGAVLSSSANAKMYIDNVNTPYSYIKKVVTLNRTFKKATSVFRFGDIDGDNDLDMMVSSYEGIDMYRNDNQLTTRIWSKSTPSDFDYTYTGYEFPGTMWDLDGDGKQEAVVWTYENSTEWLTVLDATNGVMKNRVQWPLTRGYGNNRIVIANISSKSTASNPSDIIALSNDPLSPYTATVTAYDKDLIQLWQYSRNGVDTLGHFIYPKDINGDGKDELFISGTALDANGTILWDRSDLRSAHADSIRVEDLDGDSTYEVVYAYSGLGLHVLNALDGKTIYSRPTSHAQQLEVADLIPSVPGLEIAIGDRYLGYQRSLSHALYVYDKDGNLIRRFPQEYPKLPLGGNQNLAIGDWDGSGAVDLLWGQFKLDVTNNPATVLWFDKMMLQQAVDYVDDGRDEIVHYKGSHIYFLGQPGTGTVPKRTDLEYRLKLANSTHY